MELVAHIKQLCQQHGLTLAEIERKLDFPYGSIRKWDAHPPGIMKLRAVADYFDVSTDSLLQRKPPKHLTVEEALNSVMSYDGVPITDNDREVLRRIMEGYLNTK